MTVPQARSRGIDYRSRTLPAVTLAEYLNNDRAFLRAVAFIPITIGSARHPEYDETILKFI
ncbi:hypothetical protein [Burkholderia pseudomultivorans]|uniref:hypothetical protein n=1 Tax=Burkholderia pseudomultivorans TaxID=1207504 RepID=UPI00118635A4|nr:hypothetical protein [Burkholderia pseudomultivorans]